MAATTIDRAGNRQSLGDLLLAFASWATASVGIAQGVSLLWVAFLVLMLPMVGFIVTGHLAARGAVTACLVSAIGSVLSLGLPGVNPSHACLLIGLMIVVALAGGALASNLRPVENPALDAAMGRRTTIIVERRQGRNRLSPQRPGSLIRSA